MIYFFNIFNLFTIYVRGGAVVEALRYKPEGRGFDSRYCPGMHCSLEAYCATLNIMFSSVSVVLCLV
jgi:hypothetical protein